MQFTTSPSRSTRNPVRRLTAAFDPSGPDAIGLASVTTLSARDFRCRVDVPLAMTIKSVTLVFHAHPAPRYLYLWHSNAFTTRF